MSDNHVEKMKDNIEYQTDSAEEITEIKEHIKRANVELALNSALFVHDFTRLEDFTDAELDKLHAYINNSLIDIRTERNVRENRGPNALRQA